MERAWIEDGKEMKWQIGVNYWEGHGQYDNFDKYQVEAHLLRLLGL